MPHIDNLRVKDLLEYIESECPYGVQYLPEDYFKKQPNRPWLCNLCKLLIILFYKGNTFNEEKFKELVSNAIKSRERHIIETNSLEIKTEKRIADAIMNSSFISSKISAFMYFIATRGRSHLLMRTSKHKNERARHVNLYKDEESKSEDEENCIDTLKDEIKKLSQELNEKQNEIRKNEKYGDLLSDLFQKGIIDSEGNFIEDKL